MRRLVRSERIALASVVLFIMPLLIVIPEMVRAQEPHVDVDAITFFSNRTPSGTVRFIHGEYRAMIAPGSASELVVTVTDLRAIGVVNGEPIAGVVMATDLGGSGTFYDLALLIKKPGGWTHVDTQFLGDRVKIHSVALRGNELIIDMATHGPQDPLCCPAHRVRRAFAVDSGRFVAVETTGDDER